MHATLIPGLTLTDTLFEAAADGVARYAPHLAPLTWERFTRTQDWALVPDDTGVAYKAELVLLRVPEATYKINRWFAPDLRGGQLSQPHDHPWAFDAHVLLGGYEEDRYDVHGATITPHRGVTHTTGAVNHVPRATYHEVTAIHDPDTTLTLMACSTYDPSGWGYLDLATGQRVTQQPDPTFGARFDTLNPHLR